jgi:hypothetical protein
MLDVFYARSTFFSVNSAAAKKAVRAKRRSRGHQPKLPTKQAAAVVSRATFLRRMQEAYTPEVCARMLAVNESFPIHGEP